MRDRPCFGIEPLVDVEANPCRHVIWVGEVKRVFERVVGRVDEGVAPRLLDRKHVVGSNIRVLKETRTTSLDF